MKFRVFAVVRTYARCRNEKFRLRPLQKPRSLGPQNNAQSMTFDHIPVYNTRMCVHASKRIYFIGRYYPYAYNTNVIQYQTRGFHKKKTEKLKTKKIK